MDLGLSGRRAAVAAATSGLGLATARALAAEGVRVAICGRDPERLAAAMATLPERHGRDQGRRFDRGRRHRVRRAGDRRARRRRHPRSQRRRAPSRRRSRRPRSTPMPRRWRTTCCRWSPCARPRCPPCRSGGWGRVVAITSISVRQPISGLILSNTARAGATGFLKTLALEVAGDGVTVNSLLPGSHDTPRLRSLYGDDLSTAAAACPMGHRRLRRRLRRRRRVPVLRARPLHHWHRHAHRRRRLPGAAVGL